jgi:hypothetical protein
MDARFVLRSCPEEKPPHKCRMSRCDILEELCMELKRMKMGKLSQSFISGCPDIICLWNYHQGQVFTRLPGAV